MSLPDSLRVLPPKLFDIAAGTHLHRNHHREYPGARFNPCRGAPSRFAPLFDPEGNCIPTIYAATTFDGAAYETIFRGLPSPFATIPRQDLETRGVSRIAPRQTLHLVPFFTPELIGLGVDPGDIFRPSAKAYPDCRTLAVTAWRDNPAAHGVIWASVRDTAARAMLLFGDRISEAAFECLETREIATDSRLLEDFIAAGARAGIRIAR